MPQGSSLQHLLERPLRCPAGRWMKTCRWVSIKDHPEGETQLGTSLELSWLITDIVLTFGHQVYDKAPIGFGSCPPSAKVQCRPQGTRYLRAYKTAETSSGSRIDVLREIDRSPHNKLEARRLHDRFRRLWFGMAEAKMDSNMEFTARPGTLHPHAQFVYPTRQRLLPYVQWD